MFAALDHLDTEASTLPIAPWRDLVIDRTGHDPRSAYVERFWLGVVGPSATWLLRSIAYGFAQHPDGFALPIEDTARTLGLGARVGRHSPLMRSILRLCSFDLAAAPPGGTLYVRRQVPWLGRRQLAALPSSLRVEHAQWELHDRPDALALDRSRQRACATARALVDAGRDLDAVEHGLRDAGFESDVVRSAADWAWQHVYGIAPERVEHPARSARNGHEPAADTAA